MLEFPSALNFVVSTFVIVEMADDGNEGLVYGLLTTAANLGSPFAAAISNQLFGCFQPSLSDVRNYVTDSAEFRRTVFYSFVISYSFSLVSLLVLVFLPAQKQQAQEWKRSWPTHRAYGISTMVLILVALVYGVSVDILSMFPSTMCLRFAGGDGCDD